jgi:hypothetical protein
MVRAHLDGMVADAARHGQANLGEVGVKPHLHATTPHPTHTRSGLVRCLT